MTRAWAIAMVCCAAYMVAWAVTDFWTAWKASAWIALLVFAPPVGSA